jgi:hypothetical protein
MRDTEIAQAMQVAYGDWIIELTSKGYELYLLSFTFRPLGGGMEARLAQMRRELERAYALLVTRIVRNPNGSKKLLPIWFCLPDLPVEKRARVPLAVVSINDGLHMHALVLIPPVSRLKRPFDAEVCRLRPLLAKGALFNIDATWWQTDNFQYAADYAFKSMRRSRFAYGDTFFVLPAKSSERRRAADYESGVGSSNLSRRAITFNDLGDLEYVGPDE